ncbi:MAG TPA: hypoxanthine phosphoribosyltransferase [Chloroflexota bacterium]|nr:hypoxanthine phosphoribosyltransferase [Chloroflexota bacterium]
MADELTFADGLIDRVLIDAAQIQRRVRALGQEISQDYDGREVHLIAVLKGSLVVVADLVRAITPPTSIDFIAVSSYGPAARSSGAVRLIKDLDQSIEGRHVLVVEDVIDTGLTLSYILRILRLRQPASLEIATLLDKPAHRLIDLPLRYVGFTLPDCFVVGYGLDYQQKLRNLPYLATLKDEVLSADDLSVELCDQTGRVGASQVAAVTLEED